LAAFARWSKKTSTAWTYAVRKAIEKLEALLLEGHLHGCVPEGIKDGREDAVIEELVQLYNLAGNR
jgi:CsoR family transcriptional regulator, copper-sensing transcriptional repressor